MMQYQVLSGHMTASYGYQQIHFRSRSLDDCYRFIFFRLNSSDTKTRKEAKKLFVQDLMGDRYDLPKFSQKSA
jgi:hypothetical protein